MLPRVLDDFAGDDLVTRAATYAHAFMTKLDASHDWSHILRVTSLARLIYTRSAAARPSPPPPPCSLRKIVLAALLHDVADRKYIQPGQDASTILSTLLTSFGADAELAESVQAICLGVSYRGEVADPAATAALVARHPELAVVQDADRLDAIGAIGIGRVFTYGGARTTRALDGSVAHFEEKLLHLVPLMKTQAGREMAAERTERLRLFKQWWDEESMIVDTALESIL